MFHEKEIEAEMARNEMVVEGKEEKIGITRIRQL
jgi:hypothetical protein